MASSFLILSPLTSWPASITLRLLSINVSSYIKCSSYFLNASSVFVNCYSWTWHILSVHVVISFSSDSNFSNFSSFAGFKLSRLLIDEWRKVRYPILLPSVLEDFMLDERTDYYSSQPKSSTSKFFWYMSLSFCNRSILRSTFWKLLVILANALFNSL